LSGLHPLAARKVLYWHPIEKRFLGVGASNQEEKTEFTRTKH
jgi:hypothetical protein